MSSRFDEAKAPMQGGRQLGKLQSSMRLDILLLKFTPPTTRLWDDPVTGKMQAKGIHARHDATTGFGSR